MNQTSQKRLTPFSQIVLLLTLAITSAHATELKAGQNLFHNGSFDTTGDWIKGRGVSIVKSDNNPVLQLKGSYAYVKKVIPLKGAKELNLSMRMRTENVKVGKSNWMNARLAMRFLDKDGKMTGPWPQVFNQTGTTSWQRCERLYKVPENAAALELKFGNFGSDGLVQFDDVKLTVIK